jgi:Mg2+-importing ATPase
MGASAQVTAQALTGSAERPVATKPHQQNIRVSPAVQAAARKDGAALLQDLHTTLAGLSESDADERARASGPNEIAEEHKQGGARRVLKIVRNPLLLLTLLAYMGLTQIVKVWLLRRQWI